MLSAPPGEQTFVYTITGLFGLGVLWFAGAKVPHRLRPQHAHRKGTAVTRWAQRGIDYFASAFIGMLVIWLAAWQMPTLTGLRPQELFVTIQDHLLAVKIAAFVAILARVALQEAASLHFPERSAAVVPAATSRQPRPDRDRLLAGPRRARTRGPVGVPRVRLDDVGPPRPVHGLDARGLAGRRLPTAVLSKFRYPLNLVRILVIVVLVQLVLTQLTRHLVNPTPMLGGVLIGIGVLLLIISFLEPLTAFGRRATRGRSSPTR